MAALLTHSVLREELRVQQVIFHQAVAKLGVQVQREVREELRRCLGGTSTWGEETLRAASTAKQQGLVRKLLELSADTMPALEEEEMLELRDTVQIQDGAIGLYDAVIAMEEGNQPSAELPLSLEESSCARAQASPPTINVTALERAIDSAPAPAVDVVVAPALLPPGATESDPEEVAQGMSESSLKSEPPGRQVMPANAEAQQSKRQNPKLNIEAARLKRQTSVISWKASMSQMTTAVPDETFPTNLRLPSALRNAARKFSGGRGKHQTKDSLSTNGTESRDSKMSGGGRVSTDGGHMMPLVPSRRPSLLSIQIGVDSQQMKRIVHHPYFDIVVAMLIILNGLSIGVQTDVMARSVSEDLPLSFRVVEICFCVAFTIELLLRLAVEGQTFFTGPEKGWNIFDFVVVMLQLIEEGLGIVAAVTDTESQFESGNFGFVRMLRALRLIRIIRLVRVLRLIGELRTIVMSIASSMKHLFWTLVLLLLMIYICSVPLTQMVLDHRLGSKDADWSELIVCWGSVGRSALTLFEAIFGGIDWDNAVMPLAKHVHLIFVPIFCLYIAFALLALMNVVTGVFVENAIDSANRDKEKYLVQIARDLFDKADPDQTGVITWVEFEKQLENPDLKTYFEGLGVDAVSAKSLFRILDMDNSGAIDADELLTGTLRLRGDAKAIDLAALIYESRRMSRRFQVHALAVNEALARLNSQIRRLCPSGGHGEASNDVSGEKSTEVGQLLR